jgi:methionyl-tRNA synthetase
MEPGAGVEAVMGDALESLRIITALIVPAIPATAQEIWRRIGQSGDVATMNFDEVTRWGQLTAGIPITKGDPLFPRIRTEA